MKNIYKRIISIALVVAIVVGIIISPLGEMFNIVKKAYAAGSYTTPSGPTPIVDDGYIDSGYAWIVASYKSNGQEATLSDIGGANSNFNVADVELVGSGKLSGLKFQVNKCMDTGKAIPPKYSYCRYNAKATKDSSTGKITWEIQLGKYYDTSSKSWKDLKWTVKGNPNSAYDSGKKDADCKYACFTTKVTNPTSNTGWANRGDWQGLRGYYTYSYQTYGYIVLNKGFYTYNGFAGINTNSGTVRTWQTDSWTKTMLAWPDIYPVNNHIYVLWDKDGKMIAEWVTRNDGRTCLTWWDGAVASPGGYYKDAPNSTTYHNSSYVYGKLKVPTGDYYIEEITNLGQFSSFYGGSTITITRLPATNYQNMKVGDKRTTVAHFVVTEDNTQYFGQYGTGTDGRWQESIGTNSVIYASIDVRKAATGSSYPDSKMKGAEFDVYYYPSTTSEGPLYGIRAQIKRTDDHTGVQSYTVPTGAYKMCTLTVNSSGKMTMSNKLSKSVTINGSSYTWSPSIDSNGVLYNLPYGNYLIVENKAASGYVVPSTPYWSLTFKKPDLAHNTTYGEPYNRYNVNYWRVRKCTITGETTLPVINHVKTETKSLTNDKTYSLTVTKNFQKLNNVDAFYMFAANGIYQRKGAKYDLRLNNSSGTLIAQGTTNNAGIVEWTLKTTQYKLSTDRTTISNIEGNTNFYLVETSAPYGYQKASNQTITVSNKDVNVTTGAALNEYPIEIEFSMTKSVEGDPSKTLENGDFDGAEFEVYYTPYRAGILYDGGLIVTDNNDGTRTVTIDSSFEEEITIEGNTVPTKANKLIYNVGKFVINNNTITAQGNSVNFNLPNSNSGTFNVQTDGSKFIHMPLGKYVIIETKAPDSGIQLSANIWHVIEVLNNKTTKENYTSNTRTKNTPTYIQWHAVTNVTANNNTINIVEGPVNKRISIALNKQAKNENCAVGSVKDSEYAVFYSENSFNKSAIKYDTNNETRTRTFTTIPNGVERVGTFKVNSDGIGIVTENIWSINGTKADLSVHKNEDILNISSFYGKEGYYQIIEVKAPKNYSFDDNIKNKVYYLTEEGTTNLSITSKEPSPTDPFEIIIKKEPSNLEALTAWKSKTGEDFNLSGIKSLNESYDGAGDGTEFTVKFYKGYTSWGTSGLRDGIESGDINPNITLVYKVIDGKVDFSDDTYLVTSKSTMDDIIYDTDPTSDSYGQIVFPIGILTIEESQAAHDYSIKNNKWTDEQGNVYPASADHFANGVGLVIKISQDTNNIEECIREIMTGDNTNPWVRADSITTSVSGIPEFTAINPTHTSEFTILKTVNGIEMNGSSEINNEPLANVQFTAYYFYNVANELKALDTDNNGTNDWDEFVTNLLEGNKDNYQDILNRFEATFPIVTDENGKYYSNKVPTGYYVIIEKECEANKGLKLSNPIIIELNKDDNKSETIENLIPEIHTTQWDKELSTEEQKTHMSNPDSNVYVMDTIEYKNLRPNTTYTFKSIIMLLDDQNNATILRKADGNSIQSRINFTTDNSGNGSVDMEFKPFDALNLKDASSNDITASGRKFVVYEFLFEGNQTNTALTGEVINQLITNTGTVDKAVKTEYGYVGHWSNTDEGQIGWFPKFSTTEHDAATLTHISPIWSGEDFMEGDWVHIEDLLNYTLLDKTMTYTVFLEVRNYADDSIITTEKYSLNPSSTGNGSELLDNIWFNITNITNMNKFYICETICKGELDSVDDINDSNKVGTHDAKIESQTGYIAYIGTNASASTTNDKTNSNGIYEAYAAKDVTLTDIVHAHNMMELSVSIICTYKYVTGIHAGEIVKDNKGNELTTTITYTFDSNKTDEDVPVVIEHRDLSNLKDETIVAYETITYKVNNEDVIIAKEHEDTSLTQSVAFVGIPVKFNKVDQHGNAVSGAKLEIRPDSLNNDSIISWTTTNTSKEVELIEGKYYLVETQAPDGYALAEPIEFEVKGGKIIVNGTEQTELTITMIDTHLTELPTAGGIGTLWFILSGLILMLAAVLFKKKYMA